MTPEETRYARMVKLRWSEWHVGPSRYVNDMIEVNRFCDSMQTEMRFRANMEKVRESQRRVDHPRTERAHGPDELKKIADELRRKYGAK